MSLYKRDGSKYYWMKFSFDGELVQQSTKCSNKRDAMQVEAAFRHELALGRIGIKPKKDAPVFTDAAKDFLAWAKVNQTKNSHLRLDFSFKPLLQFFGNSKVDRIETKDIENYILSRSGQKSRKTKDFITRETVNREVNALKMVFRRLMDNEIIQKNPARKIKQLAENDRQFHVVSDDEEKLYLMACPQPLQDVATLMLDTGLRCGEVYQLRRQDVSLNDNYLKVYKGKTKSSVRRVHLSERARTVLSHRMNKFTGANLFPQNDLDGGLATSALNKLHLRTVNKLNLKFRLYDCRHTFATRAVESGIDLLVLASILGHSNLKMIVRYAHPSETLKADAMRHIEKRKAKAVV